jgi:predicted Holliday junction resolvase-like endonuclease
MQILELALISILFILILFIGYILGKYVANTQHQDRIPEIREDAIKQSRAVLSGQFSEQIAPFMPDFPFKPTEARFIGKPNDFVVFKGMDEKKINEVVFVEVKSGKSNLSDVEKSLKDTIHSNDISWYEYRVPNNLNRK